MPKTRNNSPPLSWLEWAIRTVDRSLTGWYSLYPRRNDDTSKPTTRGDDDVQTDR